MSHLDTYSSLHAGNQQYASSILLVKTQDDKSLMVPEPHNLNAIRTYSVHHTVSGRGATLSESPPTSPGTPDFADYGKDGRLRSSSIDNDFCSAATQSSQRHARPQRSQQAQLQYGRVKLLTKAKPAHASSAAAIEAAMIKPGNSSPSGQVAVGAGSTQLSPKASRQAPSVVFRPASEAASPESAHLQALLSQAVSRHHDVTTAEQPQGVLPHPKLCALTGSGSADSNHAQAASPDSKHLESLLSLAMAKHNDAGVAAAQPTPQTAAQPSRIEAPSVSAGSNSNGQQHALMSPPAQSTMRSLRIGQGQMRRGHGSRR